MENSIDFMGPTNQSLLSNYRNRSSTAKPRSNNNNRKTLDY